MSNSNNLDQQKSVEKNLENDLENDLLTERDIRVLMALEQYPTGTFDQIASITGLAKSVVFQIYQKLTASKNNSPICAVTATLNLKALELKIVDVLIELSPKHSLAYIREFCEEHPYTMYMAFMYGTINGAWIQFRIPCGASRLINELFVKLQSQEKIKSFFIYSFDSQPIYTTPQVKYWNHAALKWNFDVASWVQKIKDIKLANNDNQDLKEDSDLLIKSNSSNVLNTSKSALSWLKRSDLYILIELMKNSRHKHIDMMNYIKTFRHFEFTRQTFSRRLKHLENDCITGYRVQIKARTLDIHNPILILGKTNTDFVLRLAKILKTDPLPFTSIYNHTDDTFLWYIHLPSTHLADLLYALRAHLIELKVHIIDYDRSLGFFLYSEAFDEKLKKWKNERAYMVDNILKAMDNWEQNRILKKNNF
ncbi:hypothetical protein [Candidatus Harpocratesius sp.]